MTFAFYNNIYKMKMKSKLTLIFLMIPIKIANSCQNEIKVNFDQDSDNLELKN